MPGRKLLLHSCGPTTGLPGLITTKPGRFWFSAPRPYSSHEPKLGRIGCVSPEVIISSEGSWLGTLVYIERRTHSSSACSRRRGKISLISRPDRPHGSKRKGERIRPAVP